MTTVDRGAGRSRVAVDVGGTFIDLVMVDEATGEIVIEKQPSTPERRAEEIVTAMGRLPVAATDLDAFVHGSTVVLNAILQERGATVGLITTRGFRDVLELGRGARPDIYDWRYSPPDPLVPRRRRREVDERLAADGTVLVPLDLEQVDREADVLVEQGVEAIAVVFLHAYAEPAHERLAADRIRARHPEVLITLSSDLANEWREYERTSTSVVNAFVQPLYTTYLSELDHDLREAGYARPIAVMQSNGGVVEASSAASRPVRTLLSGPAGGAIAALALSRELGHPNVIGTDVGGTSFDVVLIEDGVIAERSQSDLGGRSVLAPTIDIVSVGAGGGSIAWIDPTGSLRVGPASAGARPGPACFGFGGEEPTVTDCQLILGRLDPETFLGSRMRLHVDAARAAVGRVADPLGLSIDAAAEGVLTIAETSMSHAIHTMTVERGIDPRGFVLLAYGGGGGLFATATAEELEIPTVVVPRAPALFSAWGLLASDYREDASLTRVRSLEPAAAAQIVRDLEALSGKVRMDLARYGFDRTEVSVGFSLEMRYGGQEHTVAVQVDEAWFDDAEELVRRVSGRFGDRHRRLYGHGAPDQPVEVVTARCRGSAAIERPRWPAWTRTGSGSPRTTRPVRYAGVVRDTPVFDRDVLAVGQAVAGPALIEEWSTTVAVPPGWAVSMDPLGNLVMGRTA
ncbi:MAG: hydantoinase/oxoprolinase family protein [Actinomycetota bacterium]